MIKPREKRNPMLPSGESNEAYPKISVEIKDDSLPTSNHEIMVLDINDSGMGITCDIQLKVGQRVNFLGDPMECDMPDQGVVMWTFRASDGFRAGIKFI